MLPALDKSKVLNRLSARNFGLDFVLFYVAGLSAIVELVEQLVEQDQCLCYNLNKCIS
jgi:hypothetical protein